jgi:hypothetical protein
MCAGLRSRRGRPRPQSRPAATEWARLNPSRPVVNADARRGRDPSRHHHPRLAEARFEDNCPGVPQPMQLNAEPVPSDIEEPARHGYCPCHRVFNPRGDFQAACDSLGSTMKLNIIPLSVCSAIWQWAIHSPGFVT